MPLSTRSLIVVRDIEVCHSAGILPIVLHGIRQNVIIQARTMKSLSIQQVMAQLKVPRVPTLEVSNANANTVAMSIAGWVSQTMA